MPQFRHSIQPALEELFHTDSASASRKATTMSNSFFDSTLPYILFSLWTLLTIACVLWSMFPRYPLYDRVGQYIYDKVLWRMAPDAKTKGEPNDRRISDETFIEHESLEVHEHNGSPAAERNKRQQRRKMRERASTVTAWPMMEGDIELEDMEIRNVREFV